jgi:hypothetical protein
MGKVPFDDSAVQVARRYFIEQFPGCTIRDFFVHWSGDQGFAIERQGARLHTAILTSEFLRDATLLDTHLSTWQVADALRQAGTAEVVVDRTGIQISSR